MKMSNQKFVVLLLSALFISGFMMDNRNGTVYQESDWVAPESAKTLVNPSVGDEESADFGKSLYRQKCSTCHGKSGEGDGPGSTNLTPKPANHASEIVQSQTDGELFWKISNGRGAMTGYEGVLSVEERWDLVNFIRSLAGN